MMTKRILCVFLSLVLCVSLAACAGKSPSGSYSDETGMIIFTFEDGKVTATAYGEEIASGTFTVKGKQVDLQFTGEYAEYLNGLSGLTYNAKEDTLTDGAGAVMYNNR